MTKQPAHLSEAFRLYKANSPFEDQLCFADHVNKCLALGVPLSPLFKDQVEELNRLILSAPLQSDKTLFRATLDAYVKPLIKGNRLVYPAFMSTADDEASIKRHFSTPFRNLDGALLRIECQAGTHALDMETDASFGGHEQEFLLTYGAEFEIISIDQITDKHCMAEYMSGLYANNYSLLKVYTLRHLK